MGKAICPYMASGVAGCFRRERSKFLCRSKVGFVNPQKVTYIIALCIRFCIGSLQHCCIQELLSTIIKTSKWISYPLHSNPWSRGASCRSSPLLAIRMATRISRTAYRPWTNASSVWLPMSSRWPHELLLMRRWIAVRRLSNRYPILTQAFRIPIALIKTL